MFLQWTSHFPMVIQTSWFCQDITLARRVEGMPYLFVKILFSDTSVEYKPKVTTLHSLKGAKASLQLSWLLGK